ncbi:MAG: flagellar basal body rod protein FlgB [Pirellulaceae bacterium]
MLANIFNATTIPYLQETASFTEARHGVLAGNIANFQTPGYRTRDLSPEVFEERLRDLIEANQHRSAAPQSASLGLPASLGMPSSSGLAAIESPGLVGDEADNALRQVKEARRTILHHDKTDVGLEEQVLALSKNQFKHNMALAIMNNQFRMLQTAISERL